MHKVLFELQPQVGTAHLLLQEALSDDDAAEGQGHKHFRACGRVFKATIARADSDFYDDACSVVRYAASEPGGVSRRAGVGAVCGGWESASAGASYTQQTPEKLQQLVAPIALYPDSLVAQIMAASTFQSKSSRPTDGCKRILI